MLNNLQKQELELTIRFMIDDILECVTTIEECKNAFTACSQNEPLTNEQTDKFRRLTILESVQQLFQILHHPNPQNRSSGSIEQEGIIYWYDKNRELKQEPKGLLGLTAYTGSNTTPTSKDEVVEYVTDKINEALETKLQALETISQTHKMLLSSYSKKFPELGNRLFIYLQKNPDFAKTVQVFSAESFLDKLAPNHKTSEFVDALEILNTTQINSAGLVVLKKSLNEANTRITDINNYLNKSKNSILNELRKLFPGDAIINSSSKSNSDHAQPLMMIDNHEALFSQLTSNKEVHEFHSLCTEKKLTNPLINALMEFKDKNKEFISITNKIDKIMNDINLLTIEDRKIKQRKRELLDTENMLSFAKSGNFKEMLELIDKHRDCNQPTRSHKLNIPQPLDEEKCLFNIAANDDTGSNIFHYFVTHKRLDLLERFYKDQHKSNLYGRNLEGRSVISLIQEQYKFLEIDIMGALNAHPNDRNSKWENVKIKVLASAYAAYAVSKNDKITLEWFIEQALNEIGFPLSAKGFSYQVIERAQIAAGYIFSELMSKAVNGPIKNPCNSDCTTIPVPQLIAAVEKLGINSTSRIFNEDMTLIYKILTNYLTEYVLEGRLHLLDLQSKVHRFYNSEEKLYVDGDPDQMSTWRHHYFFSSQEIALYDDVASRIIEKLFTNLTHISDTTQYPEGILKRLDEIGRTTNKKDKLREKLLLHFQNPEYKNVDLSNYSSNLVKLGLGDIIETIQAEHSAEQLKKEQAAEQLKKEQAAEQAKKEQATEQLKKEQAAEQAKKEQAAEQTKKEQAAEQTKKEQAAEQLKKEQAAEQAKKEQATEQLKKEQAAEQQNQAKKDKFNQHFQGLTIIIQAEILRLENGVRWWTFGRQRKAAALKNTLDIATNYTKNNLDKILEGTIQPKQIKVNFIDYHAVSQKSLREILITPRLWPFKRPLSLQRVLSFIESEHGTKIEPTPNDAIKHAFSQYYRKYAEEESYKTIMLSLDKKPNLEQTYTQMNMFTLQYRKFFNPRFSSNAHLDTLFEASKKYNK